MSALEAGDSVRKDMNVLFMDIRNFTGLSEKNTSEFIFKFINELIDPNYGFISLNDYGDDDEVYDENEEEMPF